MPLPVSDDPITDQGRLYVSPSLPVGDGGLPIQQPEVPTTDYADKNGTRVVSNIINRLLGTGGEQRVQTWPEKLLRDALSAPHDIMQPNPHKEGTEEYYQYENDRQHGMPVIKAALNMSALAGTGGLAGVGEGGAAAL